MKQNLRAKWDGIYSSLPETCPQPCVVLAEHAHLLPTEGDALDLACGLGGNALFLARQGLRVSAWDISAVAVDRLVLLAERLGLALKVQERDVEAEPFPIEAFDVIVASRFLARKLAGQIVASLKPRGLLFYQTYVREKLGPVGPGNPDFLLGENELLRLFSGMRLLFYREEGRIGDLVAGRRDEAYFIGQKR